MAIGMSHLDKLMVALLRSCSRVTGPRQTHGRLDAIAGTQMGIKALKDLLFLSLALEHPPVVRIPPCTPDHCCVTPFDVGSLERGLSVSPCGGVRRCVVRKG